MRKRTICHASECPQGNTFHKNSGIVELPNDDLLAVWFASDYEDGHHTQTVYGSRLPAGKDEWTDAEQLVDVENIPVGSPVVFNGPDGALWLIVPQLYVHMSEGWLFLKRSWDNGHTWSDFQLFYPRDGLYLKNKPLYLEEYDRHIMGVDIGHSRGNRPGFLLIPDDYADHPADFPLLTGGDEIVPPNEGFVVFSRQGLIYPSPTILSDGTVLAYLRPRPSGYIWETRSTDGGVTWTQAEETEIPNPDAGFDIQRTSSGNHILVCNPHSSELGSGRHELVLFMSEDDCETWPYQFYLEKHDPDEWTAPDVPQPNQGEQFPHRGARPQYSYASIIEGDDGIIHIMYEYERLGSKHVAITEDEIYERSSSDPIVLAVAE